MKGLTIAVIAMVAMSASARIVVLEAEAAFHTDEWCADHHLGEGPSTCIQHAGCCYDGRIGICHSCDAHSDEWCRTYGGEEVKTCVGYAGCTFEYSDDKNGICKSSADPADFIQDIETCEEQLSKALAAEVNGAVDAECKAHYCPSCTAEGEWAAQQQDLTPVEMKSAKSNAKIMTYMMWCVDPEGHEIPNTRQFKEDFETNMINCDKERKKHAGQQCPNSVTLSTGNGEVMINDHEDVGNCDITCNTDRDCDGMEWCCYNGCGYSCQVPITPKADCEHLTLLDGLTAENFEDDANIDKSHGTSVTIACANGWFGDDPVNIECKHGSWDEYAMDCKKDCDQTYHVVGQRQRDYEILGKGFHHGDGRKVKCIKGYGAVAGCPDAMRFYKEQMTCVNGEWTAPNCVMPDGSRNTGEQSLECSACFDAPSHGPHAWWTGIEDDSKREQSFDCKYFASRPLQCSEFPEARKFCRISCRTCEQMLMKFKVKNVKHSIPKPSGKIDPETGEPKKVNVEKWLHKRLRKAVGYQNTVEEQRRTKVASRVKKSELEARRKAAADARLQKLAEEKAE